jgi:hypothetical protein
MIHKTLPERDALLLAVYAERLARAAQAAQAAQQAHAETAAKIRALAARTGLAPGETVVTEPDAAHPIGTVLDARTGQPVPAPAPPAVDPAAAPTPSAE